MNESQCDHEFEERETWFDDAGFATYHQQCGKCGKTRHTWVIHDPLVSFWLRAEFIAVPVAQSLN